MSARTFNPSHPITPATDNSETPHGLRRDPNRISRASSKDGVVMLEPPAPFPEVVATNQTGHTVSRHTCRLTR
jgi:hypothetical protein